MRWLALLSIAVPLSACSAESEDGDTGFIDDGGPGCLMDEPDLCQPCAGELAEVALEPECNNLQDACASGSDVLWNVRFQSAVETTCQVRLEFDCGGDISRAVVNADLDVPTQATATLPISCPSASGPTACQATALVMDSTGMRNEMEVFAACGP